MTDIKMKNLGPAKQILGLRVTRDEDAVSIDQERYIDELLEKFEMQDCNPVSTPLDVNQWLPKEMCPKKSCSLSRNARVMRSAWSVASASMQDSLKMDSPLSSRYEEPVKLSYRKERDSEFSEYSNADWSNDPETSRSFSGYVFVQSDGTIS